MNIDAVIRPYQPEDWPAMDEIVRKIWRIGASYVREKQYGFQLEGKPWDDHKTEGLRREVEAQSQNWFVTEVGGRVIGFCSLHITSDARIGIVGQNGLHPDFKGRGYGSLQLRFILDELRRRGAVIAEVTTGLDEGHAAARKLYERAGFKPLIESRVYTMHL